MNTLAGEILEIITEEQISLVKVKAGEWIFSSIVIDTPATSTWLQKGHPVKLLFKETEVIIARGPSLIISVQNKIPCTIKKITMGKILCQLDLHMAKVTAATSASPATATSGPTQATAAAAASGATTATAPAAAPEWQIRSIITRNACEQLNLQENDPVIALVKTNEVSLSAHD